MLPIDVHIWAYRKPVLMWKELVRNSFCDQIITFSQTPTCMQHTFLLLLSQTPVQEAESP